MAQRPAQHRSSQMPSWMCACGVESDRLDWTSVRPRFEQWLKSNGIAFQYSVCASDSYRFTWLFKEVFLPKHIRKGHAFMEMQHMHGDFYQAHGNALTITHRNTKNNTDRTNKFLLRGASIQAHDEGDGWLRCSVSYFPEWQRP